MGHIELAAPVVHIWYLRGTRSWLAYLLMGIEPREELKAKQLEKVIYFAANLVTWVDDERRHDDLPNLEAELAEERDEIGKETRARHRPALQGARGRGRRARGRGRQGHRAQGPPARRREGRRRHPRAVRGRARARPAGLRRVPGPARPQDHRRRAAVARAARPLRRLLRGRHGRRRHQVAHRPHRLRRGGGASSARPSTRGDGPQAPVGPAQAEGHQAAEDRRRPSTAATSTAAGSTTRGP